MRTIRTFIDELFILKRLKDYDFMNQRAKKHNRYVVAGLYHRKFYHTIASDEYEQYVDIWHRECVSYIVAEHLILIK